MTKEALWMEFYTSCCWNIVIKNKGKSKVFTVQIKGKWTKRIRKALLVGVGKYLV